MKSPLIPHPSGKGDKQRPTNKKTYDDNYNEIFRPKNRGKHQEKAPQDVLGDEIVWGSRPRIDQALSGAEIVRDAQPEKFGELLIKEETIPVIYKEQVSYSKIANDDDSVLKNQ